MPAFDTNGQKVDTGDQVYIPCVITSISPPNNRGVQQLTLNTKYKNNNGAVVTITIPSSVVIAGN